MFTALFVVCSVTSVINAGPVADNVKGDAELFAEGLANFSIHFNTEIGKKYHDQNVVASPLSAEIVLALLSLGASGQSHDQILTTLHLPNDGFIKSAFKSGLSTLTSLKGVTLDIANKVYVQEDEAYILNDSFKNEANDIFNAPVETLDFTKSIEAASTINQWVQSKTNDRIKDIITADSLTEQARLVLVNAMYFKGTWKTKFPVERTALKHFHVDANTIVDVPTLSVKADFKYADVEELDAKILELPYEGEDVSMIFFLPNKVDGLTTLLENLGDHVKTSEIIKSMKKFNVDVELPKFKIETKIDLIPLLKNMGIEDIFEPAKAKLDKILSNNKSQLYVSNAVQKVFIEVNEEGAEAAAATAIISAMRSAKRTADIFHADHPFLFVIQDKKQGLGLFTGIYNGPK